MTEYIIDPRGRTVARGVTLSPRLDTLRGKTIGLLNNRKWNVSELYAAVADRLRDEYGAHAVEYRKETPAKVCSEEVRSEMLVRAHAIVSGVGD